MSNSETLQLRDTLEAHNGWVTSLATSESSPNMLVSGSRDKSVVIWQITQEGDEFAVPKRSLRGHSHIVQDVTVSEDGNFVLSASWDKTMRLWNVQDGTSIRFVGHTGDVLSCSFSPENRLIVSGSRDKTIRVWNVIGENLYTIEGAASHSDWVSSVGVTPTQNPQIITGGWDKMVKSYDLDNCQLTADFPGHTGYVSAVTLSPDGSLAASGGKDGEIIIWDISKSQVLNTFTSGSEVNAFAFSPTRFWLAAATATGIKIYDLQERKLLEELKTDDFSGKEPKPLSVCWSSDGQNLFAGYDDSKIRVWQVMRTM